MAILFILGIQSFVDGVWRVSVVENTVLSEMHDHCQGLSKMSRVQINIRSLSMNIRFEQHYLQSRHCKLFYVLIFRL